MSSTRESTPAPWKLEWSPRHISSFWDWANSSKYMRSIYFSRLNGEALIRLVARFIQPQDTVVDFGCGSGELMARLVDRGIRVYGVDVSHESIASVKRRLDGRAPFLGADVLPLAADLAWKGKANAVLLIEAVEHMDDNALRETLETVRGLLRPGGRIIITTPNNERLEESEVFCPNCGCVFHRMQHQRSWTAGSLAHCIEGAGFDTLICRPYHTYDRPYPVGLLQRAWRWVRYRTPPHLMYVGRLMSQEGTTSND